MKDRKKSQHTSFTLFKTSFWFHVFQNIFTMSYALLQAELFSKMVSFAIKNDHKQVLRCSLLLFVITSVYFGIRILLKNRQDVINETNYQKFREQTVKAFYTQSKAAVCQFSPGEIRKNIDLDAKNVADYYCTALPEIFSNLLFVLVTIILFVRISPLLGTIFLALSILQIIPHVLESGFSYKYYDADREAQAKWSENIMSMYFGSAVIKIYELHNFFVRRFQELNKKWDKLGRKSSATGRISEGVSRLIETVLEVCSYLIIGYFLLQRNISLTAGTYILVLTPRLFHYINSVFAAFPGMIEYRKAKKNIETWNKSVCGGGDKFFCSKIVVDSIAIVYEGKTVIDNFSYTIDLSEKYFLVGDNGSGKTSLLECLAGVRNVKSGSIRYDNREIDQFTEREFGNQFVYLPQEDAPLDIMACELFCQYDEPLKGKMMGLAGEFGLTDENIFSTLISDLSGGERKKVYLSVALSMETKFLFLDEPTNGLDLESVDLLIEKIRRRKRGSLVVSHETYMLKSMREFIILSV